MMNNPSIDLAIYILFFEKVDQTIACISSFLDNNIPIYVLNNNSSTKSTEKLNEFINKYKNITIFTFSENLGVGVGRNYLIENTNHNWMFFVDNDITVTENNLLHKLEVLIKDNPTIDVFIPKLFNKHENSYCKKLIMKIVNNQVLIEETNSILSNMLPGGASIINRKVFDKLGLYDLEMFVGLEDVELAIRSLFMDSEIKSYYTNSIELIHDHQIANSLEDKEAILKRYCFTELDKSYYRILNKYPTIEFQHEFRGWVINQLDYFIGNDYSLKFLNKYYYFCANKYNENPTLDYNEAIQEVSLTIKNTDVIFSFFEVEHCMLSISSILNKEKHNGGIFVDFENYDELSDTIQKYLQNSKRIVIFNLIEMVCDIRPFISLIKIIKRINKDIEIEYISNDKLNKTLIEKNISHYYWTSKDLKRLFCSWGLMVQERKEKENIVFKLDFDEESYELFLRANFLPSNNQVLIVTQEHANAKLTGGIGSYVKELENLIPSISVLIVTRSELYPSRSSCMQSRHIIPSLFFDSMDIQKVSQYDILKECIDISICLYDKLRLIELQDIDGMPVKVLQAYNLGLYRKDIFFQTQCHASSLSLEIISKKLIPLDFNLIFSEKYVIENTDLALFPTKYLKKFYIDHGYQIKNSKYRRLPFHFDESVPDNKNYKVIDTLIFFGKRVEYKGFKFFKLMIEILLSNTKIKEQIKRIILLGPKFNEFEEENNYFDSLKNKILVDEYSLSREGALSIIEKYSEQAICYTPYIGDNHPNSVLEVINCNCLLLSSNTGGIPELIPQNLHSSMLYNLNVEEMVKLTIKWLNIDILERLKHLKILKSNLMINQNKINSKIIVEYTKNNIFRNKTKIQKKIDRIVVLSYINTISKIECIESLFKSQYEKVDKIIYLVDYSEKNFIEKKESKYDIYSIGQSIKDLISSYDKVVFFNDNMQINNYYIYKLKQIMNNSTTCQGLIFNNLNLKDNKTSLYLGNNTISFFIDNSVGHPFGMFKVKSILDSRNLDFQSIWINQSFITNFISQNKVLLIHPSSETKMYIENMLTPRNVISIEQSITNYSKFEKSRIQSNIFFLKENQFIIEQKNKEILILKCELLQSKYKRIVLYGYGTQAQIVLKYFFNIQVIVDINADKINCSEYNIIHPSQLQEIQYDYILITVKGREELIKNYLVQELQVPNEKVGYLEI